MIDAPLFPRHFHAGLIGLLLTLVVAGAVASTFSAPISEGAEVGIIGKQFADLFYPGYEHNIPTWFASSLLLLGGYLAWRVSQRPHEHARRFRKHWMLIATGLVVMSCDEASVLHERMTGLIHLIVPTSGILHHAWVIAALIALPVLMLIFARFAWALPRDIFRRMAVAAAIYLSGAVGCEMIEGLLVDGSKPILHSVVVIEESLEMLGALLVVLALRRMHDLPATDTDRMETIAEMPSAAASQAKNAAHG